MAALSWLLTLGALTQGPDSTLTLHAAAMRALEIHPRTQAAAAEVAGAVAAKREARASWFPQLTTQGSLTRFEEPMVVAPIHALDATRLAFDRILVQGDVRLSWTLFDGGGRRAGVRAAEAGVQARLAGADAAEGDVLAEVARRYLAARTAGAVLLAQREGRRALSAERDRVARLVAEGDVARVALLRVEAALAGIDAEVAAAAAGEDVALRALARTLELPAVPPGALTDLAPIPAEPVAREVLLDGLEDRSPDLRAARDNLEQARHARRRAQAPWFPRVDLQGAVVAYGDGDWRFTPEWQVGARVFYPVLLGGQRSAAVARATAGVEAAEAQARATRQRLAEAIDRALAARSTAIARVTALEAAATHLAEVARIEALALAAGAGVEVEYLRAEADARRARADLEEARAARVLADVDLARVTGALTLAWLAEHVETVP
jgi:outer membrane protein TolC